MPENPMFNFQLEKKYKSFPQHPDWPWDPASLLFNGNRGLFLGINWPGCEDDHSTAPSVKFRNEWSCTSTSHMLLWQAQNNFTSFTSLLLSIICKEISVS